MGRVEEMTKNRLDWEDNFCGIEDSETPEIPKFVFYDRNRWINGKACEEEFVWIETWKIVGLVLMDVYEISEKQFGCEVLNLVW